MELCRPSLSGPETMGWFRNLVPLPNVLVYGASDSQEDLLVAMRVGARGYVLKSAGATEFARAVSHVAEGSIVFSPRVATKLLDKLTASWEANSALTRREAQVFALAETRRNCRTIANALGVSRSTMKVHIHNIRRKLPASQWSGALQRPQAQKRPSATLSSRETTGES